MSEQFRLRHDELLMVSLCHAGAHSVEVLCSVARLGGNPPNSASFEHPGLENRALGGLIKYGLL